VSPPAAGDTNPVKPPSERRAVLAGLAFGASLLLVAVLFAISGRGGSDGMTDMGAAATNVTASGTKTMAVTLGMLRIEPHSISVPSGTHLVLQVTNRDGMRHDLAVPNGKRTPLLSRGQSARLDVGVVTKSMTLFCTVPGHAAAGMTMKVNVTGSPAPSTAATGNNSAAAAFDPMAKPAASDPYRDPRLAPAPAGHVHKVTIRAQDKELTVAPGVRQLMWTFNGTVPGPILHGHVGDTFDITFVNDTQMGHSIDFHAGEVSPDQVMRTIAPGQSLHYRFRADHSGIWMYHCSTMPMTMHIGNGMYGAVVIDPPNLPPVDQEYVLVQSELYLGAQGGVGNAAAMAAGKPDAVVFNGESNQYDTHPLTAKPGQRVRIWVLDAGLSLPTSFHVVGTQFDTVFSEGAYLLRRGNPEDGAAQVLALQPAQGGFVEFTVPAAGHYAIVSHRMADAERGAHGILLVK
jgi:nitrite reductase (NO-forming)